jgi:hypothetical protein
MARSLTIPISASFGLPPCILDAALLLLLLLADPGVRTTGSARGRPVDPMLPDGKGSSSGSMVASKRGVEADIYSQVGDMLSSMRQEISFINRDPFEVVLIEGWALRICSIDDFRLHNEEIVCVIKSSDRPRHSLSRKRDDRSTEMLKPLYKVHQSRTPAAYCRYHRS